jgi:hypothetical protein
MTDTIRYWARRADLVSETLDDETMVIDWVSGVFYRIGGVGSAVWSRLGEGATVEELADELLGRYDAEAAAAVPEFVERLQAEGLATTTPPEPEADEAPAVPAVEWPATFAPLAFDRYDDMTDLLLVDPIHDVDVAGWPARRDE